MSTAIGDQLTDLQYEQQIALRAMTLQQVLAIWPALDFADIESITATWPAFEAALATLIDLRYGDSARIAAAYYDLFRIAEGVPPGARAVVAGLLPDEQILTSIRVTGLYEARKGMALNVPDIERRTLVSLMGSTGNLVAHGGRNTLVDSVVADSKALGWYRITSGRRSCAFCRMLASRGAVYKSETTAFFRAHDHCACTAKPIFSRTDAAPRSSEADAALWAKTTAGYHGRDAINAFRRAVDNGA